jgi:hypothetical protein
MAIGTPFSGDMCEKCECTPCKCNPCQCSIDFQYLKEKWESVLNFNDSSTSEDEQIYKLQNAKIIPSKEFWEAEINKIGVKNGN